jgi:hopanoid biosynthesis associated protein HpnK
LKGLIVTADDFGAALEVNEAVEVAHRDGVLTAASLMVTGRAADDAVARAHRLPGLRVGLHLVLVEGRAASATLEIPDLLDGAGRLRADMAMLGVGIFLRSRVREQLAREIKAQFEAFRRTGLALDHVNAHKHFHLHPTVAALIVEIGKAYGLRAMRVPSEPRSVLARADSFMPTAPAWITGPWARLLRRRLLRAGIATTDWTFGLAWSGRMTGPRMAALIRHLPPGVSEIYLHPATKDRFPGSAAGYRYVEELEGLIAPSLGNAVRQARARLGGFSDFAPGA